jgi:hypothetical protein
VYNIDKTRVDFLASLVVLLLHIGISAVTIRKMMTGLKMRSFGVAAALLLSAHGRAEAPSILTALQGLQPGQWEIRSTQDSYANRSVCMTDPRVLLQLRHFGQTCSRFVITNDARISTVHYSCAVTGNGQTTIRVETPRLIQLQSQGIANQSPFSFTAEGRRVGDCGAVTAGRPH